LFLRARPFNDTPLVSDGCEICAGSVILDIELNFRGGIVLEVHYSESVCLTSIQSLLAPTASPSVPPIIVDDAVIIDVQHAAIVAKQFEIKPLRCRPFHNS
jgi:hypothetical protein